MKFVMVVSSLLCVFRSTLADECVLTDGDNKREWVVRIIKDEQTIAHGSLVSHNRVLSVFTLFIDVATDSSLISKYEFVAYHGNSDEMDFCNQQRKAKKFISPPEWPRLKKEEVRDIAFWDTNESFKVGADFPFLFPSNDDISKISQSILGTDTGTTCDLTVLSNKNSYLIGTTVLRLVMVSRVTSCENYFCTSEGVCKLGNRFDFCTLQKRDTALDSWERGAVLECNGSPVGILALNGEKPKTKGRNLYISLLTAWHVFKRMPIDSPDTTRPFTSTSESTRSMSTTSEPDTTAPFTTTTATSETRRSMSMSTTSEPNNATNSTNPGGTRYSSRIPPPPTSITIKTTERPTFLRTIPNKISVKPSKGSILVLCHGIFALCAGALYEAG